MEVGSGAFEFAEVVECDGLSAEPLVAADGLVDVRAIAGLEAAAVVCSGVRVVVRRFGIGAAVDREDAVGVVDAEAGLVNELVAGNRNRLLERAVDENVKGAGGTERAVVVDGQVVTTVGQAALDDPVAGVVDAAVFRIPGPPIGPHHGELGEEAPAE